MASTGCVSEGVDEVQNCIEFHTDFLDPISLDVRKDTISLIHELSKPGAQTENARERCDDLIQLIDRELGVENLVSELVSREMAECLRKMDLLDDAVGLITSRMERHNKEDFGNLLTLANVYELSGNYNKAETPRKKVLKLAEESGDQLLMSLALVKMACILWHMQNPDKAKEHVRTCLDTLESSGAEHSYKCFPFAESTHRLIDTYKTLGYVHRFLGDRHTSAEFYLKALEIVELDTLAHVHRFELEAQVGCEFANSQFYKHRAGEFCRRAGTRIKEVAENEVFMIHHTRTLIHALTRVAYTLQLANGENSSVLEIQEDLYCFALKYLSEDHPEVARIAADTAYLCNKLKSRSKENYYIQKAETALEDCASSPELDFLKMYCRELADAWKSLALTYSNRNEFPKAEKCFQEAVKINTIVYGSHHPRLGRLYRSMGHLYKKMNKFAEAVHYFRKCQEINDDFTPHNTKLKEILQAEIGQTLALLKRSVY